MISVNPHTHPPAISDLASNKAWEVDREHQSRKTEQLHVGNMLVHAHPIQIQTPQTLPPESILFGDDIPPIKRRSRDIGLQEGVESSEASDAGLEQTLLGGEFIALEDSSLLVLWERDGGCEVAEERLRGGILQDCAVVAREVFGD